MTPSERGRLLYRVARELEARTDEFAELETVDTGKPLAHARGEISGCVGYLDYYAGMADKIHDETIPLGPDYLNYTVREPLGVTAQIVTSRLAQDAVADLGAQSGSEPRKSAVGVALIVCGDGGRR